MNSKFFYFLFLFSLVVFFAGCINPPVCGNGICEIGENVPSSPNYCPADCGTPACKNEGETGTIGTDSCCQGLSEINDCNPSGSGCVCAINQFICTQCGNQTCGLGENQCNCLEDCVAETHTECQKQICATVQGAGTSQCSADADCQLLTHTECQNEQCVTLLGEMPSLCTVSADCQQQTHMACFEGGFQCVELPGGEPDSCQVDADCQSTFKKCVGDWQCLEEHGVGQDECLFSAECGTKLDCINGKCVQVLGYGENKCLADSDCSVEKHNECREQQCVQVQGQGTDRCQAAADCSCNWLGKVYVVKDTNSLLRASSFVKNGCNIPLVFYTPGRKTEIINFIQSINSINSIELVHLGKGDFGALESTLAASGLTYEKKLANELINGSYDFIAFSDNEELMPYAAALAGRQNGLFFYSISDAATYINSVPSGKIDYFGNNSATLSLLQSISSNLEQFATLREAEIKLAPTNSIDKVVTVIAKTPSEYSRLGALFSIYRDSALISATGAAGDAISFDQNIDLQLNLIKPFNGNKEYDYMVIVADWVEIPYNFFVPTYICDYCGFKSSADMMYADRDSYWSSYDAGDEDKTFIPDMGVGRILGYDLTSASILQNMGYLQEKGLLVKSAKAIYSSDWAIDGSGNAISLIIIRDLNSMYGGENVYAVGDPTSENYINNAPRDEILTLSKDRDFILLQGHGTPNYLSATSPTMEGDAILAKRPFKPAFWYLSACDTIGHCPSCPYTNLDGSLRSLAKNVYGTVDIWGTGSGWEVWYTPYFARGYRIGDVIRLGLQDANVYFKWGEIDKINPNMPSQFQIIGDPLISYGGAPIAEAPKMGLKAADIFRQTSANKKIMYLLNNMVNVVQPPFQSYYLKFLGDCGKMIVMGEAGLEKISGIEKVEYNTIKSLTTGSSETRVDVNQNDIHSVGQNSAIVPQESCTMVFEKK